MQQSPTEKKLVENEAQEANPWTFRFYEVMNYPIPEPQEYFVYTNAEIGPVSTFQEDCSLAVSGQIDRSFPVSSKRISIALKKKDFEKKALPFSRQEKSPLISEFLSFIQKRSWLYKNFPFVQEIYLANSISFNALHKKSDLDLFVMTKPGRIWTARLGMTVLMAFFGIKRSKKSEYKKFCLSFFIDREHTNLEELLLDGQDVYLPYRIAHLVPLYQEQRSELIYKKNARIQRFLPYFPLKQSIFLGNQCEEGSGVFKKCWERLLGGSLGNWLEKKIQQVWTQRILRLKNKKPERHQGILIEKGILKFHYDQRKKYSDLFFSGF